MTLLTQRPIPLQSDVGLEPTCPGVPRGCLRLPHMVQTWPLDVTVGMPQGPQPTSRISADGARQHQGTENLSVDHPDNLVRRQ